MAVNGESRIQQGSPAEAQSLIEKARGLYESDDGDLEIDDDARFSSSDGGCWVSAWVWVPKEDQE
jgi:hypothetical protein